ncbi:MAG: hypothetical protein RR316_05095 [Clostridia bacterium]
MKYNMASNASCVIKKRVQQELNDSAYLISINDCVAKYKSLNSFGYKNFNNNNFTKVCYILEIM